MLKPRGKERTMFVKVEAYHDGTFWCARGLREDLFTQGRTLDELLKHLKEAVSLHFENELKQGKTLNLLLISETELKRGAAAGSWASPS